MEAILVPISCSPFSIETLVGGINLRILVSMIPDKLPKDFPYLRVENDLIGAKIRVDT